jgi:crossover junction endodeoxyribonuclease RuvC
MRILGIDPGTNIIGWGIIEKIGSNLIPIKYDSIIIKTNKNTAPTNPYIKNKATSNLNLSQKLEIIYNSLIKIINEFKPDIAAVEELFFVNNIKTGISVGHARGVILLALQKAKINIFEYKPLEIKQAVVGYGKAEKKQVQVMVKNILKLDKIPKPDDTADALAVAICHNNRMKWNKILEKCQM